MAYLVSPLKKRITMSAGSTGGGISVFSPPPPYQEGAIVPPTVTLDFSLTPPAVVRKQGRGVPDVASNADIETGYSIFYDDVWSICGGTSAAAPLWAALILCLNEQLKTRVGFIQPLLYKLQLGGQPVCRTITQGNNGGFEARPELLWNGCTGLGSPDYEALSKAFSQMLAPRGSTP